MLELFATWTGAPAAMLEGWEATPFHLGGEVAAVAITRGTEIHFACAPSVRRRLILRSRCRAFLAPLLERRGYLTTRAVHGGPSEAFLLRLGFKPTGAAGGLDHYMLTALPFGRE